MEFPPDIAVLLSRLRAGLAARGDLVGLYVYGSLVTGDFSPACSDIDVIVMVKREPDRAALGELARLHKALASSGGAAERLNFLYVAVQAGGGSGPLPKIAVREPERVADVQGEEAE